MERIVMGGRLTADKCSLLLRSDIVQNVDQEQFRWMVGRTRAQIIHWLTSKHIPWVQVRYRRRMGEYA